MGCRARPCTLAPQRHDQGGCVGKQKEQEHQAQAWASPEGREGTAHAHVMRCCCSLVCAESPLLRSRAAKALSVARPRLC